MLQAEQDTAEAMSVPRGATPQGPGGRDQAARVVVLCRLVVSLRLAEGGLARMWGSGAGAAMLAGCHHCWPPKGLYLRYSHATGRYCTRGSK
jgi:hypothetical protein